MPYLVAAVILIGAVTALNLLLTTAVIRRLRRQESQWSTVRGTGLPVGAALPDFTAETTAEERVERETVLGQAAIFAFFDTSCTVCKPSLKYLIEYIDHNRLRPYQAIAVVSGDRDSVADFCEPLAGRAAVIFEASGGPVTRAFQIQGTPTFVMVDSSGIVTQSVSGAQQLIDIT